MKRCIGRKYEEGSSLNIGGLGSMITRAASTTGNLIDAIWDTDDSLDKAEKPVEDEIGDLANTQFSGSNATLLQMSKNLPIWQDVDDSVFGGKKDLLSTGIEGFGAGLSTGLQSGLGWYSLIPAVADAGVNVAAEWIRGNDIDNRVASLNKRGHEAERRVVDNLNAAIGSTDQTNDRWRMQNMFNTNYAADGGLLETNGAMWQSGSDFVDNGGTHEMNPFGGVQYGIASDGLPNFVEEGEVVIDLEDSNDAGHTYAEGGSPSTSKYVLSNRVLFEEPEMDLLRKVTDKPEQYVGKSYADIYKDIFDKNRVKERINSQYIKDYVTSLNERMAKTQEATKLRKQQEELIAELKKATPEEQEMIMQQFGINQQQPMQGEYLAAEGGKIYIKPSKRGTFTAAAKSRGMGVQEFASKVLANKEDYSPAMVKKANFARNASHWHPDGGFFTTTGTNGLQSNQSLIVPSTNYNQAKYFTNIVDANGNYLPGYVDWVKSLTQADYDYLSGLEGFDKTLNPNLATFKIRATDKKFRNTHAWINSLYRPEERPAITPIQINIPEGDSSREEIYVPQVENPNFLIGNQYNEANPYPWYNPVEGAKSYDEAYLETVPEAKAENEADDISTDKGSVSDMSWILPAISGASVLGDVLGLTNTPDYSNANRIGRAILPPTLIGYNPNGRYVKPRLVDTRYLAARLANQGLAGIGAAKDLSGANRATALANIAAQNYLTQQAMGEALAQGETANNAAIQQAVQLNNAVDRANAEGALQADRANQSILENYAQRYANQKTQEARLRETIDNQVSANKSANWNNFLENLEGYFENQRNRELANLQYGWSGYSYQGQDSKIHLQYKTPAEKKQAEEYVKKLPKDKQTNYIVESI